jgi:hypothetical protein
MVFYPIASSLEFGNTAELFIFVEFIPAFDLTESMPMFSEALGLSDPFPIRVRYFASDQFSKTTAFAEPMIVPSERLKKTAAFSISLEFPPSAALARSASMFSDPIVPSEEIDNTAEFFVSVEFTRFLIVFETLSA